MSNNVTLHFTNSFPYLPPHSTPSRHVYNSRKWWISIPSSHWFLLGWTFFLLILQVILITIKSAPLLPCYGIIKYNKSISFKIIMIWPQKRESSFSIIWLARLASGGELAEIGCNLPIIYLGNFRSKWLMRFSCFFPSSHMLVYGLLKWVSKYTGIKFDWAKRSILSWKHVSNVVEFDRKVYSTR